MEELDKKYQKEVTDFIDKHNWSFGERTAAAYCAFHVINVILEDFKKQLTTCESQD